MSKQWIRPVGMLCAAVCAAGGVANDAVADQAGASPAFWQGAYVRADAQAWSNGMPVMNMDGPWQTGYERRNGMQRAYQSMQLEAGVLFKPSFGPSIAQGVWQLGVLRRAEAFVSMSGDTAELLALYQRRADPASPTPLDLDHQSLSWRGQGIRVQPPVLALHLPGQAASAWGAMKLSMSVQWLSLDRLRTTSSAGDAAYEGAGSYAYQASLQDDNSRARIPFVAPPAPSGQGVSLSWGLAGQLPAWQSLRLPPMAWSLRVSDAWSRLRWQGINGSDGSLTSQVTTKTPDGYINYEPALQTTYTERTLQTRIPTTVDMRTTWQADSGDWFVHLNRRWGLQQAWLGWQHTGPWHWQVAVEPRAKALQAGFNYQGLQVLARADKLGNDTHVQGVTVGYAWQVH